MEELTEWRQTPSIGANKSSETLQTKDAAAIGAHLACWCELKDLFMQPFHMRDYCRIVKVKTIQI